MKKTPPFKKLGKQTEDLAPEYRFEYAKVMQTRFASAAR
jgi:hypothetical protein